MSTFVIKTEYMTVSKVICNYAVSSMSAGNIKHIKYESDVILNSNKIVSKLLGFAALVAS